MRFLAVIMMMILLAPLGCSSEDSGREPAPSAGTPGPEERAEIEKWNSYVDLGNNIDTSFYQVMEAYFRAFGNGPEYKAGAEPEAVERFTAALAEPGELSRAIDQALANSTRDSKNGLDLAVEEVAPLLRTLWDALIASRDHHLGRLAGASGQTTAEAGTTETEAETGDAAANGTGDAAAVELHARIFEAYQGLAATYDRFRDRLNQADAARRQSDLQAMAARGLVIRPAMLKLLDQAQALQDFLSGRSVTSRTLAGMELEDFEPLYVRFSQSFVDYEQAAASPGQAKTEGLASEVVEAFSGQAGRVRASADALVARRMNLDPLEEAGDRTAAGTPEEFAEVLGELVDLYNSALNRQ